MSTALPAGWEIATAEGGKEYYFNRSTGQVSFLFHCMFEYNFNCVCVLATDLHS